MLVLAAAHALVHADPGGRKLLARPAAGLPHLRARARVRVHPGHDRRASSASSRRRPGSRRGCSTPRSRSAARSASRSRLDDLHHADKSLLKTGDSPAEAFTCGYQHAFWVMVGLALAGAVRAFVLVRGTAASRSGGRGERAASRVRAAMAREYPTVLELVGDTPLVRLQNVVPDGRGDRAREARVPESRRLDQGPDRDHDDRGGRARREAQAGRDDRRADLRQHRHRPRDRGRAHAATAASS